METRAETRLRLLLVSDHRAAADALAEYLGRHGFDIVARAATAAEAAAAVRSTSIDVALIDGDLAAGWRSVVQAVAEPLGRNHIAVLSSYLGQQERTDARRSGVGSALLKRVAGANLAGQLRALAV